ncbi:MAG: hypothetical protein IT563_09600 [Alphaproteobacteria bacterium]|nr:hypothetical protein [Alphaproteobacteria bacterium]
MTAATLPQAAEAPRPNDIAGFLDALDGRRVFGWAWDRANPAERLRIEIRVDDAVAADTVADRPRPDLKANGIGDGAHAFEAMLSSDAAAPAALIAIAISPSSGARHILERRPAPRADGPDTGPGIAKVEPLIDLLHASQRRAVAAMQAAERKFDEAAARLTRLPELTQTLDQIRATQGDLARRIAEAEVFLVRFDGVLSQLEKQGQRRDPETLFNRQLLLLIGLGVVATAATIAAVVMAVLAG